MRRLALAVLLVSSGVSARSVVQPTDTGAGAKVIAVRGELEGSVAKLRVRYAITVVDPGWGSVLESIEIPARALVTAATVRREGVTHRLDLVRAEQASKQWDELGAAEDGEQAPLGAQRTAVMITGTAGSVSVSIATPRAGRFELELELAAQTCYFRDARYLGVPETWAAHTRGLRVTSKPGDEAAEACALAPDAPSISFAVPALARRPSGDRVTSFAGRLVAGQDHFARVELDVSGMLADVPHDLATVIVVDGSRSMTVDQREAQRELVAGYLRAAKNTRVQVVAFSRTAGALLPSWSIASRAGVRVDRELRGLAPRNGSNLDAGLAEAGRWLAHVEGTRRVVLVTDELMASRLQVTAPAALKRELPPGTLVHVVSAIGGGPGLVRSEDLALAPLAMATDGIPVRLDAIDGKPVDATMLVRPISIDQLTVTAPGWTQFEPSSDAASCELSEGAQVAEGNGCVWWGHGDVASGPIAIAGLVWGRRITRVLRPDPAHALSLARELTAAGNLEPELLERVSELARGVSSQWSLYAAWGGSARYPEGFGFGISGTSCCGGSFSSTHTIGHGISGSYHAPENLTAQLAPAVAACQLGTEIARVTIEMTLLEIVDVTVMIDGRTRTHPNELRALRTCVEDAIWSASPMLARPLSHSTHSSTFGGT